jgi:N-acetylmuramic acid 6-phosphate etherase
LNLQELATERPNSRSADLDTKSALEIVRIINSEDAKVAAAVERALPQIAKAIDWIADALANGGRLIYVGTGTSGRIAALDASECSPTFGVDASKIKFVMAGGVKALGAAVEADEDSEELGVREIRKRRPGKDDVVVGIAASGRTPFTIAAIGYARGAGSKTVAITCNVSTPLEQAADHAIVVETGAEVVTGSTRMKAGTAEKMVLNMLSTGAMVRLGYVYGNLMVNLHQKNRKLAERAISIVEGALLVSRPEAQEALALAKHDVPVAIVMGRTGIAKTEGERVLRQSRGNVRLAIAIASSHRKMPHRKNRAEQR